MKRVFLFIYIYLFLVMLCFVSNIYLLYVAEMNICVPKMSVVSHLTIDSTEHLKEMNISNLS